MRRFIISAIACFVSAISVAQTTSLGTGRLPFAVGEEVSYRAYYNWRFIWLSAGNASFTVKDTVFGGQSAFHFVSKGWSLKDYDWFFKVRDRFESIADKQTLRPYWFLRSTHEGGYKAYNRYEFDYLRNQVNITSYTSERPFRVDNKAIKPGTFDVLSAIYYCRTINFDGYRVGDSIPITMAIDNDVFDLYIRYLGKEVLKIRGGAVYSTIKFSVMLVEGTIFKGGEDMTVWVIDDANRIPVMVEAKILIGSVKAVLTGATGLNN